MQENMEAILAEIETLKEQIENLEARVASLEELVLDADIQETTSWLQSIMDFEYLNGKEEHANKNVVIVHKDCFRTAALVDGCKPKVRSTYLLYHMNKEFLQPLVLMQLIENAREGECFVLDSEVFSYSELFTAIILSAIDKGSVYFVLLTNNLHKIPQSILAKCSVIE